MERDTELCGKAWAQAAATMSEAVLPLLDLDDQGRTNDYQVALALSVLAYVAGSLLAQRTGPSGDKLLSTFWDSVSTATDTFKQRVEKVRAEREAEEG